MARAALERAANKDDRPTGAIGPSFGSTLPKERSAAGSGIVVSNGSFGSITMCLNPQDQAVAELLSALALEGVVVAVKGHDFDFSLLLPPTADERGRVYEHKQAVWTFLTRGEPWPGKVAAALAKKSCDRVIADQCAPAMGRLSRLPLTFVDQALTNIDRAFQSQSFNALRRAVAQVEADSQKIGRAAYQ